MTKYTKFTFSLVLWALATWIIALGVAYGAPNTSVTTAPEDKKLFASVALSRGSSSLSNPVPNTTESTGNRTELMLLATYDIGAFTLEGGAGWMHDELTGTANPSGFGLAEYKLTTDATVFAFSPQAKLGSAIRLGPLVELLAGEDVSFVAGVSESPRRTAWLGGLQALYEFRLGTTALRAGARYLSSLGLPGQQLRSVQATLQFGLPIL